MPLLVQKRINIIHDFQNVNSNISFFDKKYFFCSVAFWMDHAIFPKAHKEEGWKCL